MRRRRFLRAFLVLCMIPLAVGLAAPSVAHADAGLEVSSLYTYTIDPTANVVHVVAEMTFTNTVENQTQGGVVNRTYFDGFSIPLPAEAVDAVVTQDGATLEPHAEPISGTTSYYRLNVDFADRLFHTDTAEVTVTYDIKGQEPRADAPTRVNAAYAAFNAYGIGDPGKLTVRVLVPSGYEIDTLGADAVQTEEDGYTVYTASDIDQPQDFNLFISARNDAALTENDVTLAGADFSVRAWPGDTEWDAFVEQRVGAGMPVLEDLVGRGWPVDDTVEIREAFTPYLYGYAGWFDPRSRELEIGEDLDPQTLLHELSHAWFNRNWFDERWISEGLAQEYAGLANAQLGDAAVDPDPVDQAAPGALPLNTWTNPELDQPAGDTEDYGYNTSWYVIASIVGEVGNDGMRAVFEAADENTVPYVGDVPAEPSQGPHDWRRFLDLVDELAGATTADQILAMYALTPDQAALLPARDEARADYESLVTHGGEWAPPLAVRTSMSEWDFASAEQLIDESSAVLDQRDDLESLLATIGVPLVDSAEKSYENTTTDLTSVASILDDEARAANSVIGAIDAEAADPGFLGSVGMYGKDLKPLIEDARAALAAGDFDLARARADEVRRAIADSDDVGRTRVVRAVLALVALLLVVLFAILLVRRRHASRTPADEPAQPPELDAPAVYGGPPGTESASLYVGPTGTEAPFEFARPPERVASPLFVAPVGEPVPLPPPSPRPLTVDIGPVEMDAVDTDAVDTL